MLITMTASVGYVSNTYCIYDASRIGHAIIKYINTADFPDHEDTWLYNNIKFYLSSEMDEEITLIMQQPAIIKYSASNYFARYKINMLFCKRHCYIAIKFLIDIDKFIWSCYSRHEESEYYSILKLLSETNNKQSLKLELLNIYNTNCYAYLSLLELYQPIYSMTELSDYIKTSNNKNLISAFKRFPSWKAFDGSLRKVWMTAVIIPFSCLTDY